MGGVGCVHASVCALGSPWGGGGGRRRGGVCNTGQLKAMRGVPQGCVLQRWCCDAMRGMVMGGRAQAARRVGSGGRPAARARALAPRGRGRRQGTTSRPCGRSRGTCRCSRCSGSCRCTAPACAASTRSSSRCGAGGRGVMGGGGMLQWVRVPRVCGRTVTRGPRVCHGTGCGVGGSPHICMRACCVVGQE